MAQGSRDGSWHNPAELPDLGGLGVRGVAALRAAWPLSLPSMPFSLHVTSLPHLSMPCQSMLQEAGLPAPTGQSQQSLSYTTAPFFTEQLEGASPNALVLPFLLAEGPHSVQPPYSPRSGYRRPRHHLAQLPLQPSLTRSHYPPAMPNVTHQRWRRDRFPRASPCPSSALFHRTSSRKALPSEPSPTPLGLVQLRAL